MVEAGDNQGRRPALDHGQVSVSPRGFESRNLFQRPRISSCARCSQGRFISSRGDCAPGTHVPLPVGRAGFPACDRRTAPKAARRRQLRIASSGTCCRRVLTDNSASQSICLPDAFFDGGGEARSWSVTHRLLRRAKGDKSHVQVLSHTRERDDGDGSRNDRRTLPGAAAR